MNNDLRVELNCGIEEAIEKIQAKYQGVGDDCNLVDLGFLYDLPMGCLVLDQREDSIRVGCLYEIGVEYPFYNVSTEEDKEAKVKARLRTVLQIIEKDKGQIERFLKTNGQNLIIEGRKVSEFIEQNRDKLKPLKIIGAAIYWEDPSIDMSFQDEYMLYLLTIFFEQEGKDEWTYDRLLSSKSCSDWIGALKDFIAIDKADKFIEMEQVYLIIDNAYKFSGGFKLVDGGFTIVEDEWLDREINQISVLMDENGVVRYESLDELKASVELTTS